MINLLKYRIIGIVINGIAIRFIIINYFNYNTLKIMMILSIILTFLIQLYFDYRDLPKAITYTVGDNVYNDWICPHCLEERDPYDNPDDKFCGNCGRALLKEVN